MNKKSFWITFWIILLIASCLRFYNHFHTPYTHDEYSAIHRTNFDNVSELIEKGVLFEGHPAGVQLFLYFYVKIFGAKAWSVRVLFILLGIGSTALIMLIGKKWYSPACGLLSGSIAAVTQYFIYYSQMARPYSPGLFFTLLVVFLLQHIIERKKTSVWLWVSYRLLLQ